MIEVIIAAAAGGAGGFVRTLVTGKGTILLPEVKRVEGASIHLNLGILAPIFIGALAGIIAPFALGVDGVIAALAGYTGSDFIENIVERRLKP